MVLHVAWFYAIPVSSLQLIVVELLRFLSEEKERNVCIWKTNNNNFLHLHKIFDLIVLCCILFFLLYFFELNWVGWFLRQVEWRHFVQKFHVFMKYCVWCPFFMTNNNHIFKKYLLLILFQIFKEIVNFTENLLFRKKPMKY